jgi:hypothetical protein
LLKIFLENIVEANRRTQLLRAPFYLEEDIAIKDNQPSIPWICGFFDAEGSFSLASGSLSMSISQKDREVLEKIKGVIGGKITPNDGVLCLRSKEALKFFPNYIHYSRNPQKLERILTLLKSYSIKHTRTLTGKRDSVLLNSLIKD